jgi:hypothetical protein
MHTERADDSHDFVPRSGRFAAAISIADPAADRIAALEHVLDEVGVDDDRRGLRGTVGWFEQTAPSHGMAETLEETDTDRGAPHVVARRTGRQVLPFHI